MVLTKLRGIIMKTIFKSILIFLLILNSYAQDNESWNVLNEGFQWRTIDFVNENVGWIAGDGKILKTVDGAVTWNSLPIDVSWRFTKIAFINENVGWAIVRIYSYDGSHATTIQKTEDGGQSWSRQGKEFQIFGNTLYAVNDTVVYLIIPASVFSSLFILKTTDGGITWHNISPYSYGKSFNSIWFQDSRKGVFIGASLDESYNPFEVFILRTYDGGQTWQEETIPEFSKILDLQIINDSTAYFIGRSSRSRNDTYYLCKTTDTLNTWTTVYIHPPDNSSRINSFYYINETNLFANMTDSAGTIRLMKSNDGGYSWEEMENNGWVSSWWANKIYFLNESVGFAESDNLSLQTFDGGNSWSYQHFSYNLNGIHFFDKNAGFIYGGYADCWGAHCNPLGYLSLTTDGRNFTIKGPHKYFNSGYFVDRITGFLLNGYCYKTRDGGENWEEVYVGGEDINFLNENTGWIVGSGIFETIDCGENWDLVWSHPDTNQALTLQSISVVDTTAWTVGETGLIVKYTPQNQWQLQPSETDLPLNDVFFSDEDHGWIAGGYLNDQGFQSILLKTSSGGQTWSEKRFDRYLLNDIFFEDSSHGWAVGSDTSYRGILIETQDGGDNWNVLFEDLSAPLNALHFKDGYGWAVGDNGLVLRTDGVTWIDQNTGEIYPSKYSLSQNFPNPFNPITTISYRLPKTSSIELSIFNILGQKVATLVNKKQPAGIYNVEWDAGGFASGIYIYRIKANNGFINSRKLVLLK
jgi:photosystem II stability/assembly factor-like uncharacterized protein